MKQKIIILIILIATILCQTACTKKEQQKVEENLLNIDYEQDDNLTKLSKYDTKNPIVALYIEKYGSVVIELYPEYAPNTVNNFISLVKEGFYDQNTIHRLVDNFVLQGGDPTGTGAGGPNYSIKGEFKSNGVENNLKHEKGVISMARSSSYDSAGSQFFIVLGNASHLDGEYASFGKVIDGWENIEKIAANEKVQDYNSGKLANNLTIKKALVDLKDYEYSEVEKIIQTN